MRATRALSFAPMAVHIGEQIKRVLEEVGMPKTTFATRINIDPSSLHRKFKDPTWDTGEVMRASRVLRYNFFRHLSEEFEPAPPANVAAEPIATYKRMDSSRLRMVFEIDPQDLTAKRVAEEMAERLLKWPAKRSSAKR